MSDVPIDIAPPEDAAPPTPASREITPTGQSAMQGGDDDSPSKKGSDFEKWARTEIFKGEARRLTLHPEDNAHLDQLGDGVGISKERRITDAFVDSDGAIWELKSGYEKGGLDQDQLFEYSLMEQAGYVNVREGHHLSKVPIKSINYLFATESAAQMNEPYLRGLATPWYVDHKGRVQLLKGYDAQDQT